MNKRGSGIPLGERRRSGADPDCPVRHCWVADAVDRSGVKRPGLLVEWRRTPSDWEGDWEGRVVYAASLRPGEWALVEEWLPADVLTPR